MSHEIFDCLSCHTQFTLQRHRKIRWLAAGIGAWVGNTATESVFGSALTGALAYGVISAIDEYRAHRCPECQVVTFPATAAPEDKMQRAVREAETSPSHH